MTARDYLQRFWLYFSIAGIVVILLGACIFVVATLPPRSIVMATGAEGGANYELGVRYREILAQAGIELRLLPTTGGLQNLARLRDPKSGVGVGFIQGGTTTRKESPELESLGTVFYEQLWFFYRHEIVGGINGLSGRRVSIGPEGSGTRMLALELIEKMKIGGSIGKFLGLTPQMAGEQLIAGDIDAAFIVTAWDSPIVQRLITAEGIEITSFPRADAIVALYPFLNKLVLPAAVGDLVTTRPPTDIVLLAPKASLVVRADLHPAIQFLLLNAAARIHSEPGIFQKAGQFPAAESVDLPLSEEAQRFYRTGRPFLHEHLPFWVAILIERILIILLPLVALLYPAFKLLQQMYDWIVQSRIRRLYDEMKLIESEIDAPGSGYDANVINGKLIQLSKRANRQRLPTAYASSLYTLRVHIGYVRAHLAASPDQTPR